MEYVIAAAYKVKPEFRCPKARVLKHENGRQDDRDADDIYNLRIARHHAEIIHLYGPQIDQDTDGFYTSYGRYVTRREAAQIALASGQITECHYWPDQLDSSDLFDLPEFRAPTAEN